MFFNKFPKVWIIHDNLKCLLNSVEDLVLHCEVLSEHFPGDSATLRFQLDDNEVFELDFCPIETGKRFIR